MWLLVGKVWTMSEAAGASARAIRQAADATLADVAKAAKGVGLPWSTGRVGDFESGRIAPSLPTLIAVVGALSEIVGDVAISLPDLFAVDGDIRVNDTLTMRAERIRDLLRGSGFEVVLGDMTDKETLAAEFRESVRRLGETMKALPSHLGTVAIADVDRVDADYSDGDARLARSLGVDKLTAITAMAKAWGKTFVQQRDAIAGPGANAQRKGIVARQLKAELRAVIDGDDQ